MIRSLWATLIRLLLLLAGALYAFCAARLGLQFPAAGCIVLATAAWRICRPRWQSTYSFGSARVSDLFDLLSGRLLCERGLILGRVGNIAPPPKGEALRALVSIRMPSEWAVRIFFAAFSRLRRSDDLIRIDDFVHLGTFAPAGGGKTVSTLGPNLLSYEGNCVVLDKGGELYRLSAVHRRKKFKHQVVRLDPAILLGPGADCWNVLDGIKSDRKELISACRDIANMIVARTGTEHEPHFNDSAENVIAAMLAYVCAFEGDQAARNLKGVRTQLASRANYSSAVERMREVEGYHGIFQSLGSSLGWHVEREQASVMSTVQRHTNIFDDPLVDEATWRTTFDPGRLRTGRITIYIVIPPDRMVVWAPLWRLWLGSLLRIASQGVPSERNPVLFMIDECAHIGKMQALEDAITLLRGSGVRIWLFFQAIDQLKKCFGDNAGTVLDNLGTQQYMSITSYETADAISERGGDSTIVTRTEGTNRGVSIPMGGEGRNPGSTNSGSNTTYSETGRRLFKPEEILVLPESAAIIFHKNNYPILCKRVKYYADRAFRKRGILSRWWSTRTTSPFGAAEMVLALAMLASAGFLAALFAKQPVPDWVRPNGFAPRSEAIDRRSGSFGSDLNDYGVTEGIVEP